MITHPCWDLSFSMLVKMTPGVPGELSVQCILHHIQALNVQALLSHK